MKKIPFILKSTLLLIFVLASVSHTMPPPLCEFSPDSGYQGETLTIGLAFDDCVPYSDEAPIIFFDEPGIQVLEVMRSPYNGFVIEIKIEPYTSPGRYSPYVILGDEVVLTPEEASSYYSLEFTVKESPPRFSLYPEQPQRAGAYGLYLISGFHTNFENGSTFVLSDNPGIFSIFHFVVAPEYLLAMVWVEGYVEEGSYDLTIITENERITEKGILKVIE